MAQKDLAYLIDKAIEEYDPNCSYQDLAKGVSEVLKKEYGSHLFNAFITELKTNLNKA